MPMQLAETAPGYLRSGKVRDIYALSLIHI